MLPRRGLCTFLMLIFICFMAIDVYAEKGDQFYMTPSLNKGKKWNVGIWLSGSWLTFTPRMYGFVEGLMELGWIEKEKLPEPKDANDSDTLIAWLEKDAKSKFLSFSKPHYWNSNYDKNLWPTHKADILDRYKKREFDILVAAGTDSGKQMAQADNKVPTLIMSVSDAVKVGIAKSVEDSGFDHINVGVSPKRYLRQLQLFHQVVKFKRLGLIYDDTETGKAAAALEIAQNLGKEKSFEVISCTAIDNTPDKNLAYEQYLKCLNEIIPKIDAMYTGNQYALQGKIVEIQAELNKAKIPSFSLIGSDQVKYGLLMSIAQTTRKFEGKKVAQKMAQVFNGAKPRELEQEVD